MGQEAFTPKPPHSYLGHGSSRMACIQAKDGVSRRAAIQSTPNRHIKVGGSPCQRLMSSTSGRCKRNICHMGGVRWYPTRCGLTWRCTIPRPRGCSRCSSSTCNSNRCSLTQWGTSSTGVRCRISSRCHMSSSRLFLYTLTICISTGSKGRQTLTSPGPCLHNRVLAVEGTLGRWITTCRACRHSTPSCPCGSHPKPTSIPMPTSHPMPTEKMIVGKVVDVLQPTVEMIAGKVVDNLPATKEVIAGKVVDNLPATKEMIAGKVVDNLPATKEVIAGKVVDNLPATKEMLVGKVVDALLVTFEHAAVLSCQPWERQRAPVPEYLCVLRSLQCSTVSKAVQWLLVPRHLHLHALPIASQCLQVLLCKGSIYCVWCLDLLASTVASPLFLT